jgi:hypothetical protein
MEEIKKIKEFIITVFLAGVALFMFVMIAMVLGMAYNEVHDAINPDPITELNK